MEFSFSWARFMLLLLLLLSFQACVHIHGKSQNKRVVFSAEPRSVISDVHCFKGVVVANNHTWQGIHLNDNKAGWKVDGTCSSHYPISSEGVLYLAPRDAYLLRVAVIDGAIDKIPTNEITIADVLCHDEELVLAKTVDAKTVAYSVNEHRARWISSGTNFVKVLSAGPIYVGTTMSTHVDNTGPSIMVIDKKTGAVSPFPLQADKGALSYAAILDSDDEQSIYIGLNYSGYEWLQSIDPWTLKIRWEVQTSPVEIAVNQDKIIVKGTDGVQALSRDTGRLIWNVPFHYSNAADVMALPGRLNICSSRVLVISELEEAFYSIDIQSGQIIKKFRVPSSLHPLYCNGLYYYYDNEQGAFVESK